MPGKMASVKSLAAAQSDHLFLALMTAQTFSDTKINGRQFQRAVGQFHQDAGNGPAGGIRYAG